jgi:hypothetical protein
MLRLTSWVWIGIWFTNDANTICHYWRWFLDVAVKRKETINTASKIISSIHVLLHMSALLIFTYLVFWGLWMDFTLSQKAHKHLTVSTQLIHFMCSRVGLGGGGEEELLILIFCRIWIYGVLPCVLLYGMLIFNFSVFQLLELWLEQRSFMDREKLISVN